MKHIKKLNKIVSRYNKDEDRFMFDPSEGVENTTTFYLHKGKQGFAMEILIDDKDKLEQILTKNKIDYTVAAGNVLPF